MQLKRTWRLQRWSWLILSVGGVAAAEDPVPPTPPSPLPNTPVDGKDSPSPPTTQPSGDAAKDQPPQGDSNGPSINEGPASGKTGLFGWIRASFEHVQKDSRTDFVGQNSGFVLNSVRFGYENKIDKWQFSYRVAMSLTSDPITNANTPQGRREVALRDAYLRQDFWGYAGIQVGQFRIPFLFEDLRAQQDLLFASRAVAQEGVLPGRGFQETGIGIDREVGVMISPPKPIKIVSELAVGYYFSAFNGNGQNQLLNDNNSLGLAARGQISWGTIAQVGGGFLSNKRTVGSLPNLYDESDNQWGADALFAFKGIEVFGQYSERVTKYDTVATPDRKQVGYHAQVGYRIPLLPLGVIPGYRYAVFDPWAKGASNSSDAILAGLDKQKLTYHTIGLRLVHPAIALSGYLNYTITVEEKPRRLDNNRLEILAQYVF